MPRQRFNTLTLFNFKKLVGKYRKAPLAGKLIVWASIIGLSSIFVWVQSPETAIPYLTSVSVIAATIHVLITYTAHLLVIIPNALHLMIMPFTLGYYWALGESDTAVITNINTIYTWGALLGVVTTPLFIWAVLSLTRGKLWVTFTIGYLLVDLFGLAWAEAQPLMGLWIPLILAVGTVIIRSKFLHRLIRRDRYTTGETTFLSENKPDASALTVTALEEFGKYDVVPFVDEFFDCLIITKNRVFAAYSLNLEKTIRPAVGERGNMKLRYKGADLDVEMGYILNQTADVSKYYSISKADITPLVICHDRTLPKDKRIIAQKVTHKQAGAFTTESLSGMVYLIAPEKLSFLETGWRDAVLSKRTQKRVKEFFTDSKTEEKSQPQKGK